MRSSPALLDRLVALEHAHALWRIATEADGHLVAEVAAGMKLRKVLLAEARAFVLRRPISKRRLAKLKGGRGYAELRRDLVALAELHREVRGAHPEGVPERREVIAADVKANGIFDALANVEKAPRQFNAAVDLRLRVFTAVVVAYAELRRAVVCLR